MSIWSLNLPLYWHTVRHLKAKQLVARLQRKLIRPSTNTQPAPSLRHATGVFIQPAQREPSITGPDRFFFLNQSHALTNLHGWDDPSVEKLWRYNLHYFDDLNARDSHNRHAWHCELLRKWIQENPPGQGSGWDPYPTSLRVVNWIKWLVAQSAVESLGSLTDTLHHSLAIQTRWLHRRIEVHLLGNHLFANAKALLFAGLYFRGEEAKGWLTTALKIIDRELSEQVLPDGGNFERSTMYHALFLEDVLDLINAAAAWPSVIENHQVQRWRSVAVKMLEWLLGMCHPDGQIGLFNDAAFGIAPTPEALQTYARRLGIVHEHQQTASAHWLDDRLLMQSWLFSGYVRLSGYGAVALLDVAPIGPDYLPGHAHADTLSFELSVHGERLIVNGGTSCYELGAKRLRERQTKAHSTVVVADASSSEVWEAFRVARRARPFHLETQAASECLAVGCSHDGYARLSGRPIHRRQWILERRCLWISDNVSCDRYPAVSRYILHPTVTVQLTSRKSFRMSLPNHCSLEFEVMAGSPNLEVATYSPEFGKTVPTRCIAISLDNGKAMAKLTWQ